MMDREIEKLAQLMFAQWGDSDTSWNHLPDKWKFKWLAQAECIIDNGYRNIDQDRQRIVGLVRELIRKLEDIFESRLPIQEDLETLIREILQKEK